MYKLILGLLFLSFSSQASAAPREGHWFDGHWEQFEAEINGFYSDWTSPDVMAGIIYNEAASFRPSTPGGPNNPEGPEATAADRDKIYQAIALTLKCRKRKGMTRGTAPPADLNGNHHPSADAARAAAKKVDDAWNKASEAAKDGVCRTRTHFWMECWRWDGEVKVPTVTTSAKWVMQLKEKKSNYSCLPPGEGAAIQNRDSGNEWCIFCIPEVPVK